jgi:hypothetical protein
LKKIIVRDNTFAALPGKMTTHAWEIPPTISYDEWRQAGLRLDQIRDWTNFAIGDWLEFGNAKWGEKYSQAASELKIHPDRLRQLKWVSSRVPAGDRNNKLTWSHHYEVASLATDKERKEWLARAEQENWQVRELREKLNEAGLRPRAPAPVLADLALLDNQRERHQETVTPHNGIGHIEAELVVVCPVCDEAPATILVCPKCVESVDLAFKQIHKKVTHKRKGKKATRRI